MSASTFVKNLLSILFVINLCGANPKEDIKLFNQALTTRHTNDITIHFGNTAFTALFCLIALIQIFIFYRWYVYYQQHRQSLEQSSASINHLDLKRRVMEKLKDIQDYVGDYSEESDSTQSEYEDETSNDETDTSDI